MAEKPSSNVKATQESQLRGRALHGSEQLDSADHLGYAQGRNPDIEINLDGQGDTLYADGLEIEDDSLALADTRASTHRSGG